MSAHPFYIVDVFAEEKYAGNQLAVVQHAHNLGDTEMQKIAREMNFAETTFILSDRARDGGYDVRIFTPAAEVPFAGHPTLGTAYIIREDILRSPANTVTLNLKVGPITVTFDRDVLWMKQIEPTFGATRLPDEVAPVVGLDAADIDPRFPAQEVSTGLRFLIVPLKTLDAVKRARVPVRPLKELLRDNQSAGVLVFAPETYHADNQLNVRVFVPDMGVPEDPATGSGNGCLAAYLVRHRYFGGEHVHVRVEQGYEIKRASLLFLRAGERAGAIDVNVGGKVFFVARGELA